ncbi:MAG: hypothetical protein DSY70_02845 [Desulfobulbus sp.]|nr:MAG: hypothetical protein DSY70_02845 [Desulfobulbus sp.]
MNKRGLGVLFPILITVLFFMPIQLQLCMAAESSETIVLEGRGKQVVAPVDKVESEGMSTPMMIGIGVGVAALAGGAIALGSGGGGDSSASAAPAASQTPPTSDMLVSAWNAAASQAGSGLTYTGVYQLFQGGAVGYDLLVSDGEHLVGGGNWSLNGFTLTIHTDHGSRYVGNLQPGNLKSVSLVANTGWSLTLAR